MTQELIRFRNEGLSNNEIAQRLNISLGNVTTKIKMLIQEGILTQLSREAIEKLKKTSREITLDADQFAELNYNISSLFLDNENSTIIDRAQLVKIAHEFASKNPQYKVNQILNFIINNRKLLGNEITILNQQTLTDTEKLLIDNLINAGIPVLEISERLIRSRGTIREYLKSKREA